MLISQYRNAVEDLARAQQAFDEVENRLLTAVNELLPLKRCDEL